jgi:hypothetical protein
MSGEKRIDHFNTMVGLIFAQLYESFPIATEIDEAAIADAMEVTKTRNPNIEWQEVYEFGALPSGDPFRTILWAALVWLRDEGFIRGEGRDLPVSDIILTSKALLAMNAIPEGLDKPLGARLTDAAKDGGKAVGNAAMSATMSEIVGQVLGSALRGWMG